MGLYLPKKSSRDSARTQTVALVSSDLIDAPIASASIMSERELPSTSPVCFPKDRSIFSLLRVCNAFHWQALKILFGESSSTIPASITIFGLQKKFRGETQLRSLRRKILLLIPTLGLGRCQRHQRQSVTTKTRRWATSTCSTTSASTASSSPSSACLSASWFSLSASARGGGGRQPVILSQKFSLVRLPHLFEVFDVHYWSILCEVVT